MPTASSAAETCWVLPSPTAIDGRSAIIKPFVGHAALHFASGAAPATYGENKNCGENELRMKSAGAATSTLSRRLTSRPCGNANTAY